MSKWMARMITKANKKLQEQSWQIHQPLKKTLISELDYINFKHLMSSTVETFYHLESGGVHLGLITKLIESDIFLSGFWDPPSCQSAPILFAFPLILLLLWDEHWAPLTSKTCLKHSLAFRIKVRNACQGCTAMHWHGKAAMTASQWQKLNMTITERVFVLNLQSHRWQTFQKPNNE